MLTPGSVRCPWGSQERAGFEPTALVSSRVSHHRAQRLQANVILQSSNNGNRPQTDPFDQLKHSSSTTNIDAGIADVAYWDLLAHPDIDESISRAKSASDAAVLRRKGHLKEQDRLIEFMREMHDTHTCEEVMLKMERWVQVRGLLSN